MVESGELCGNLFTLIQTKGLLIDMFRGINIISLDSKGRLAVPARYRERLYDISKGHLVCTIDTEEHCLLLYPLTEWEKIEQKIDALPSFNPVTRRIQRLLLGHASELELDKQGRILLPSALREHANIDKQVVLLGQGKKFELWDETSWKSQRDQWMNEELTLDQVSDDLGSISL